MPNKVEIIGKMLNSMFSYPPSPPPLKKSEKTKIWLVWHTLEILPNIYVVLCMEPFNIIISYLAFAACSDLEKIKYSLKGTQKLQKITNTVSLSQGLLSRILDLSDRYPTHFRFLYVFEFIVTALIALIKIKL